jgi:hypothetical protein
MIIIKIIDKVLMGPKGPVSQLNEQVHLRQGDMDGACGPYTLMMSLIINGVITRDSATSLDSVKGSTRLEKFRDNLLAFGSLCNEGTFVSDLEWLTDCFKSKVKVDSHEGLSTKQLAATIKEYTDQDNSVILGLHWQGGGGHWVVVVGYELVGEQLTKLFVLDPGYPPSMINSWNAVIDLFNADGYASNKSKFSAIHWTESTSIFMKIDDCVAISSL